MTDTELSESETRDRLGVSTIPRPSPSRPSW